MSIEVVLQNLIYLPPPPRRQTCGSVKLLEQTAGNMPKEQYSVSWNMKEVNCM